MADSTTPGQVCVICGIDILMEQVWVDAVFDEARCDSCVTRWGNLPIGLLRADVAVRGVDWFKLSHERKDELLTMAAEKHQFEKTTEKNIKDVENEISIAKGLQSTKTQDIIELQNKKENVQNDGDRIRKDILLRIRQRIEAIKAETAKEGLK